MNFTWFKDGVDIDETKAKRSISILVINLSEGIYQYTLVIHKAHALDEGIYTCHVSDWGFQQCKEIHVNIASAPEIRLTPMSATVEKVKIFILSVHIFEQYRADINKYIFFFFFLSGSKFRCCLHTSK